LNTSNKEYAQHRKIIQGKPNNDCGMGGRLCTHYQSGRTRQQVNIIIIANGHLENRRKWKEAIMEGRDVI